MYIVINNKPINLARVVPNFLMVLILVYFGFHVLTGQKGLFTYFQLKQELTAAQEELDEVKMQRLNLEHRVSLVKEKTLDQDMLDEQARRQLGYIGPNEQVIFLKDKK